MQSKFYSRQIKLVGKDGQEKLGASKVLVVGAGGLGSPVLLYLAAVGVGHIGIVDFDVVEMSNLNRQTLYTPEDVGRNKSEVSAFKIKNQNPSLDVKAFPVKLNQESVDEILKNYEIVVDCTDNFETKFLLHDSCFLQNKKLVQASIYQFEGNLHVFDFSKSSDYTERPCLRCLWSKAPDDGLIGTCSNNGVIGATAGVLGALQAMEVSKLILKRPSLKNGEGLFVDLISHDFEKRRWKKSKACPLCSNQSVLEEKSIAYKLSFDKVTPELIWIDLRSKNEIEEFRINKADLIEMPLAQFDISKLNSKKTYLLICQNGHRSHHVAKSLRESGHDNFFSLLDGLQNIKK